MGDNAEVSREDFHRLTAMVEQVRDCLMVSTPQQGCVLDTLRKHDAQIIEIKASQSRGILAAALDSSVRTISASLTGLALLFLAKGLVVSMMAEAIKLAGVSK